MPGVAFFILMILFAVSQIAGAMYKKRLKKPDEVQPPVRKAAKPEFHAGPSVAETPVSEPAAESKQDFHHSFQSLMSRIPEDASEGEDPCHEYMLTGPKESTPAAENHAAAVSPVRLSANEMVRAVVWSEILTRPADRRNQYHA